VYPWRPSGKEHNVPNGAEEPGLLWEQVKTSRADAPMFSLEWQVHRAKVPGGWLVLVLHNANGLTFYPDPEHAWKI
jgi:hypothetical protein